MRPVCANVGTSYTFRLSVVIDLSVSLPSKLVTSKGSLSPLVRGISFSSNGDEVDGTMVRVADGEVGESFAVFKGK